jgi:hypothetical protein
VPALRRGIATLIQLLSAYAYLQEVQARTGEALQASCETVFVQKTGRAGQDRIQAGTGKETAAEIGCQARGKTGCQAIPG